jgi:Rap1 Myb domain
VLLEKLADVLIADHARQDAPPGSTSWKYIENSIKQGSLCNIEEHRIGHANVPRPSGSTTLTKGVRNPFTDQDDQTLIQWVEREEKAGGHISGNQALAEQHPNHTWQSWRDRWTKRFAHLPRANLPISGRPEPELARRATTPSTAPPPAQTTRLSDSFLTRSPAKKRFRFTEEEDRILAEHVVGRIREGEKEGGNKIYKELEEQVSCIFVPPSLHLANCVSVPKSYSSFVARSMGAAPVSCAAKLLTGAT